LEINKDESITAGEARTENSHHDEPTAKGGFLELFLSLRKLKRLALVHESTVSTYCVPSAGPGTAHKMPRVAPAIHSHTKMGTADVQWAGMRALFPKRLGCLGDPQGGSTERQDVPIPF
jgi:hypothetical protein